MILSTWDFYYSIFKEFIENWNAVLLFGFFFAGSLSLIEYKSIS